MCYNGDGNQKMTPVMTNRWECCVGSGCRVGGSQCELGSFPACCVVSARHCEWTQEWGGVLRGLQHPHLRGSTSTPPRASQFAAESVCVCVRSSTDWSICPFDQWVHLGMGTSPYPGRKREISNRKSMTWDLFWVVSQMKHILFYIFIGKYQLTSENVWAFAAYMVTQHYWFKYCSK